MFQRSHVATLVSRLAEPPNRIVAVFGPRHTGKTTIVCQALQQIEQDSLYLSGNELKQTGLLSPSEPEPAETAPLSPQVRDVEWLVRNWEEARRRADQPGQGFVLVLDEIQNIRGWSSAVKGLWDADRARGHPLHVVILGSAPLFSQSGLNESLAGRFETVRVTHWSFSEMSSAFGLTLPEYLYFGGYPGAAEHIRDPDRWREYVLHALIEPNIERDIFEMTRVDKPALLKRLFELGAAYSGQILSYNKMIEHLQDAGNTTTLARYLKLLSDVGLLTGLPKHDGQPIQRKESSPKLIVLNTALMTAGSGYSFGQAQADRTFWGWLVESSVGAHLFNSATSDIKLRYWQEKSREVDFMLQRGPTLMAAEVKSRPRRSGVSGLAEFAKRFGTARTLLVGEGGVPLNEFLSQPASYWLKEAMNSRATSLRP